MKLEGYKLAWEDDFSYEGKPDENKWMCETGEHWANNEQQAYTDKPENVCVKDGMLRIRARKEPFGCREYTSARLSTYGKKSFQYGYFEIRAKLPGGFGSWPAFWMLPDSIKNGSMGWPECGEIDMMEHIGRRENKIWYSLHSGKHNHTRKDTKQYTEIFDFENVCSVFHTYGMEWTQEYVAFYFDEECIHRFSKADDSEDQTPHSWPFDQPFHFIINIAVGGGLGGEIDDSSLPYELDVDYVRVYTR